MTKKEILHTLERADAVRAKRSHRVRKRKRKQTRNAAMYNITLLDARDVNNWEVAQKQSEIIQRISGNALYSKRD